jgi:hypothetical protein
MAKSSTHACQGSLSVLHVKCAVARHTGRLGLGVVVEDGSIDEAERRRLVREWTDDQAWISGGLFVIWSGDPWWILDEALPTCRVVSCRVESTILHLTADVLVTFVKPNKKIYKYRGTCSAVAVAFVDCLGLTGGSASATPTAHQRSRARWIWTLEAIRPRRCRCCCAREAGAHGL